MQDITLEAFDPREASDEQFAAYYAHFSAIRAERLPDDPPIPLEAILGRYRGAPDFHRWSGTLARDGHGTAIGVALLGLDTSGDNGHVGQLELSVLPSYRRRGLGRRLLRVGAEAARAHDRRLLLGFSTDRAPDGEAFARAVGAEAGLQERHSQLVLAELDRAMLREWQARAQERAAGFELMLWENEYPEQHIEAFASLCETMNTAPRGDLDVEDNHYTPEKVRQWLAMMRASGETLWTMVARERSSGALAGCSELFLHPGRPTIVQQGATMVGPTYRNKGLGRWLKAAMLEQLLRERPEARFVRTDNATSNAPMLAINIALGFKPFMVGTIWQLETARALEFASPAA